jgi:ribosome recycling factor
MRFVMSTGPIDIADIKRRMQGAISVLKTELSGLRTGRASASLLEPIQVNAYGSNMPLNQVASVNVPEPRLLSVQVWDRGMVAAVEKAIRDSNLGLNPQTEGQVLRVRIPELTQDRRQELVKVAHKYAEAARVSVRHVRRDGLDTIKKAEKDGEMSSDDLDRLADQVQKATDQFIAEIDQVVAAKEKEILAV